MTSRGTTNRGGERRGGWRRICLSLFLLLSLLGTSTGVAFDYYDDDGGSGEGGESEGSGSGEVVEKMEEQTIHSSHVQREVRLGERFYLKCRPENMKNAMPQDLVTVWYFNSEPLKNTQKSRIRIISSRVTWPMLYVKEARREDSGIWACMWRWPWHYRGWVNYTVVPAAPPSLYRDSNMLDGDEEQRCIPPEFTRRLYSLIVKPSGNVADLKCQSLGSHLNITWFKNGERPARKLGDIKMKGVMLKMENLVLEDSGNYTCVVSNACGSLNHTYNLEVIGGTQRH